MNELAILTLTPGGLQLGRRLAQALGHGKVLAVHESTRHTLQELFRSGRPLVCIMALGIVVRILGCFAKDKETDPPVVVVDEAGQFAISVLGGHVAGANALARQVAKALDAVPVITTASDALGLPSVDLIGRAWGWKIERCENLGDVAAAVVRGETIGVWQTAGRRDWWQAFGTWPSTFQLLKGWPPVPRPPRNSAEPRSSGSGRPTPTARARSRLSKGAGEGKDGPWAGLLVISDESVPAAGRWPTVIYRPPTLVLGVGCRRGVSCDEIESLFQHICRTRGFSPLSLGTVATATLKADEGGLQAFVALHGVPLRTFTLEELAGVAELPTPSETVRAKIGVAGVAEPAAMLTAGTTSLLMPKYRGKRVTMALARREE